MKANAVLSVLKFIYEQNKVWKFPIILIRSVFFQIFKKLSRRIISKKIFNKKEILLFPNCNISTLFIYTDIPDKAQIEILRNVVDNNTVFLDVGANIGSHSVMVMDKTNKIYAFEPNLTIANRCKMNFLLNGLSENNVIQAALGDRCEKVFLSNDLNQSTLNRIVESFDNQTIEVKMITLDDFADVSLDKDLKYFLKIDTEGYELKILRGARKFLNDYKVTGIIFECDEEKIVHVRQFLQNYNFNISKIDGGNYYAKKP